MAEYQRRQFCILVKAYPQASQKYEETVCVAAVDEQRRLTRLYPIRFRHLAPEQRFTRFDWIECDVIRASEDPRPESFRVKEDLIRIVKPASASKPEEKVALWKPSIVPSFDQLQEDQRKTGRSLGVVRPDDGSVRFRHEAIEVADPESQETARSVYHQQSLLEAPLHPLPAPEFVFRYQFTSAGKRHVMQLHDWEVETTYHNYKRRYGPAALDKMAEYYQTRATAMNLHLIMGNMHKRPWQFIIIGVLRTTADVDRADAQAQLL
jgi:hypothetical protein